MSSQVIGLGFWVAAPCGEVASVIEIGLAQADVGELHLGAERGR